MTDLVRRGEIYWVDWSPGRGSEQTGERPSLVIQNDIGNKVSPNIIVACLTTAPNKPYPFLVNIKASESGLGKDGAVDLASIMTTSKSRLGDKCGELKADKMAEVDRAIKNSLDLK